MPPLPLERIANSELSEALAALPEDIREPAEQLSPDVVLAHRAIPQSLLHRSAVVASTAARITLGYAALGLRYAVTDGEQHAALRAATDRDTMVRTLAAMSYLRGAMAKLGQLIGQSPDATTRDIADTLCRLCFAAPRMQFALLREQVRAQLGS